MAALRKWLIAGLLVIVPLVITLGVLNWIIGMLDQTLAILPEAWQPDRLLGVQEIVVKPVPKYIQQLSESNGISGCTLLGDGSISLVLDAQQLGKAVYTS